jgi:two-component system phosphate regulon response regulator OmpR
MDTTDHVLIVDDDRGIRELIAGYLEKNGMRVSLAANGRQMRTVLEAGAPDLIVLDLMMPGEDGLALCRELRASRFRTVPVLMLTALNEEADRILGLEMGADDYLPKPFNPRELVARIHAVLRRQSPSELPGAPSETTEVFEFGEFALNLATRTLTKAGQEIPLTTGEFSVLKVFARHPRQPLSREKLMELARGREYEVFDRSLDVQISRLRKLIEPDPGSPRFIQTVWGLGYVFIPDGAA